jgi:hypothetical protein
MDANRREVAVVEQSVQLNRTGDLRHKDNNLIEFQSIQQIVELPVFLLLFPSDVLLL